MHIVETFLPFVIHVQKSYLLIGGKLSETMLKLVAAKYTFKKSHILCSNAMHNWYYKNRRLVINRQPFNCYMQIQCRTVSQRNAKDCRVAPAAWKRY